MEKQARIGVAVIGAGYWGPNLIRIVRGLPDAELCWVCDLDPERRARVRQRDPGVRIGAGMEEALADPLVDAVILATPVETHAALGRRVLEAGKHLLVEKPLAHTAEGARGLVATAQQAGLVLMVGHVFEYNAAVRRVRVLIEEGEIGEIRYLHSERTNLGQIQTACSALWSLAPHDVSIANYLIRAEPLWVQARGFRFLGSDVEDVVFLTVGYPGDRAAQIHASWLHPQKVRRTTVVGDRKMLVYDEMSTDHKVVVYDKGVQRIPLVGSEEAPSFGEFQFLTRTGDAWMPRIDFVEPLREEVSHFVDCVRSGREPLTGGSNGLAVVRVLEAAQLSLDRGSETVRLDSGAP